MEEVGVYPVEQHANIVRASKEPKLLWTHRDKALLILDVGSRKRMISYGRLIPGVVSPVRPKIWKLLA
jgi:hypothetical protein